MVFYQQIAWNFMGFFQLFLQHQILAVSSNLWGTHCSSPPPPKSKVVAASSPSSLKRLEALSPPAPPSDISTLSSDRVPFSLLLGFPSPLRAPCRSLGKNWKSHGDPCCPCLPGIPCPHARPSSGFTRLIFFTGVLTTGDCPFDFWLLGQE